MFCVGGWGGWMVVGPVGSRVPVLASAGRPVLRSVVTSLSWRRQGGPSLHPRPSFASLLRTLTPTHSSSWHAQKAATKATAAKKKAAPAKAAKKVGKGGGEGE